MGGEESGRGRGTRTIGDLNKKNATFPTAESFLTAITLAERARTFEISRVIRTSCRGLSPDVARRASTQADPIDHAFAGE